MRCAIPTTDQAITDANVDSFINDAIQRVSFAADWWWLEALDTIALTDTDNSYTFAAGTVRRWVSFSNKFGHVLEERPVNDLLAMQKLHGDGVPMFVGFEDTEVYFSPGSNGAQNIDAVYVGYETALSGDTDEPAMPSVYDETVIWYACHLVFSHRRMPDEAVTALAQHKDALADMIRTAPVRARSIGGGEPSIAAVDGQ